MKVQIPTVGLTTGPERIQPSIRVAPASAPATMPVPPAAQPGETFTLSPTRPSRTSEPAVLPVPPTTAASSSPRTLLMEEDAAAPAPAHQELSLVKLFNVSSPETAASVALTQMRERESTYLDHFPYKPPTPASAQAKVELRERYADSRVSPQTVNASNEAWALERGVDLAKLPADVSDRPLDADAAAVLKAHARQLSQAFFNSPQASLNPDKQRIVSAESERFVDLALQAKAEGDPQLSQTSAADLYRLMASNIGALAVQDRAASENAMGDHGVRHLVGHNITVCEKMADELQKNGAPVSAKERLILHQTMILHDLGYSTENVRGAINKDGILGQDSGHPVLAARYVRERFQSADDPLGKVFGAEDMGMIHRCILYHDMDSTGKAGINFTLTPQGVEDRARNLESATRLADNTHAFDDKLAEFLYRNPKTLVTMRQIKTAGQLDEPDTINVLKGRLKEQIAGREDLSRDDRHAMGMAVDTLQPIDVDFSVRRIFGQEPQYSMDSSGKVTIKLQESAIHKDVAQLSGDQRFRILKGWVKDLSDAKLEGVQPDQRVIDTPRVRFELELGHERARAMTPFQSEIAKEFIHNEPFSRWAAKDARLSLNQTALGELEKSAAKLSPGDLRQAASTFVELGPKAQPAEVLAALKSRLGEIRSQRHDMLAQYMCASQ